MEDLPIFSEYCYNYRCKNIKCDGCQYLKYCSYIDRHNVTFKEKYANIQQMIRKEKLEKLLKNHG